MIFINEVKSDSIEEDICLNEKFVRTNIYEDGGKIWFTSTLIEATKDLPVKSMKITRKLLDSKIFWTLNNFFDLKVHIERIEKADLSYPVIVGPKDTIIDGWHRLMKAVMAGKTELKYVKLDKMPPEDKF